MRFASLSDCSAEPTGVSFDQSGKIMYVHVQHAGGSLGTAGGRPAGDWPAQPIGSPPVAP
ncbi:MAG TPA: hypothetical protein VM076_01625 [Gemmatimonadaceae bacterium]|nr:hypothetical protein [Gemmatimonadaceae bacterium]